MYTKVLFTCVFLFVVFVMQSVAQSGLSGSNNGDGHHHHHHHHEHHEEHPHTIIKYKIYNHEHQPNVVLEDQRGDTYKHGHEDGHYSDTKYKIWYHHHH